MELQKQEIESKKEEIQQQEEESKKQQISTSLHPLSDTWVFWVSLRGKKSQYGATHYERNLQKISEINTLEDFFNNYSFIKRPCDFGIDTKLMLFRKSCQPLWEDYVNGGTWILKLKRKQTKELNLNWEQLCLALIGEEFNTKEVVGIILSKRYKINLLEVWIKNRSEEIKIDIGEKLRVILDLNPQNLTFFFKCHDKSLQEQSTFRGTESYVFIQTPLETPMVTPAYSTNPEMQQQLDNFTLD